MRGIAEWSTLRRAGANITFFEARRATTVVQGTAEVSVMQQITWELGELKKFF
jgi:uncharacterized caspase-like protein